MNGKPVFHYSMMRLPDGNLQHRFGMECKPEEAAEALMRILSYTVFNLACNNQKNVELRRFGHSAAILLMGVQREAFLEILQMIRQQCPDADAVDWVFAGVADAANELRDDPNNTTDWEIFCRTMHKTNSPVQ